MLEQTLASLPLTETKTREIWASTEPAEAASTRDADTTTNERLRILFLL
jgi:hypothetical protein